MIKFKRKRKLFYKSLFYKMLFKLTVADLLTALISDTEWMSFLLKEYIGRHIEARIEVSKL